jgi:hypothetical protein
MLRKPLLDPLKRWVSIQNVNLRDHSATDELINVRRDLAKIGQNGPADHQHQSSAEDLVVLQQPTQVVQKVLYHRFPGSFLTTYPYRQNFTLAISAGKTSAGNRTGLDAVPPQKFGDTQRLP